MQVGTCYWPEEARVDPLQNRSSVAANLQLYSRRDATRVSYAVWPALNTRKSPDRT